MSDPEKEDEIVDSYWDVDTSPRVRIFIGQEAELMRKLQEEENKELSVETYPWIVDDMQSMVATKKRPKPLPWFHGPKRRF